MSRSIRPPNPASYLNNVNVYISDADIVFLTSMPTADEINHVIFDMKPWTIPGHDGFPPGFYQMMWDTVGTNVVKMVQSLFHSHHMLKQINHNFTALIPKHNCPKGVVDFKHISLCNVKYKIILKLLASRLKTILHKIISPDQSAFLAGRQIQDNIVIAHKVLHSMKKTKANDGGITVKVDISKAFDRVEWTFFVKKLQNLGFSESWCKMIEQCISTVSTSILLNGSPGEVYFPQRGLRQGDPLSPYMFILIMECFYRSLNQSEEEGLIHGFKPTKASPSISHLFFPDDSIAFSSEVPNNVKNDIVNVLQIRRMDLQERRRLAPWKPKYIAQPGKTVLNQSVLGSTQNGKGGYMKGWSDMALPKELGGLNIRRTDIMNIYLLAKIAWRMLENPDAPWVKILRGNEDSVHIWKHNWIPDHLGPPTSQFISSNMTYVKQLIDQNNNTWNVDVLNALFDQSIISDIRKNKVPMYGADKMRRVDSRSIEVNSELSDWMASSVAVSDSINTKARENAMECEENQPKLYIQNKQRRWHFWKLRYGPKK
ncbi:uncharacterized protein LOC113356019 [Papaver somniferum]|uniref:uncharacterized protein LOC113356019 n=1 Tax=Papaver somniferum TaxID=3469 RepID=UPI000E701013|nr:uncharacterized protein LOC113356019 [Papaver somniferum]